MSIILQPETASLQLLGQAANAAAERAIFKIYQDRRPKHTLAAQRAALKLFTQFLGTCGIRPSADLYEDPAAWVGVTFGLCLAFQSWQLQSGYSIGTINQRVSILRQYMKLANSAGFVPDGEIIRLGSVRGYTEKEGMDTDRKRAEAGIGTRRGGKKSTATTITAEQAAALCKAQNAMPQARRDALLFCLLIDHALRVSEIAILKIEDIDLESHMMTFHRPKTGILSRHILRGRAWRALVEYLQKDNRSKSGALILASHKTGELIPSKGFTVRGIQDRVRSVGRDLLGIDNLSPHDFRHHAATQAGRDPRVSLGALMEFGGWKSANCAIRYMNRGECDNSGVFLGLDEEEAE